MATTKTEILVYAHWIGMKEARCIGVLSAQQAKGRKAFSFEYSPEWIKSEEQLLLDPEITWYPGQQYPDRKDNFGVFLDSMPDTWGRKLMRRRAALKARKEGRLAPTLYDTDYLLGVSDESRMGGLRFKLHADGPFLDNNPHTPTPPLTSIRELQYAADIVESDADSEAVSKWLAILIAPGSSLGGARPKANVIDEKGALWIAKFPSRADTYDKAAWEYLAYQLALKAGIQMAESRIEKVTGKYHTFFTRRFDRQNGERIHFASAMTMTGNNEDTIKEDPASYLDIAEFIQFTGAQNTNDLHQLWRRIVFNIAISNTDDHLRNHGFILTKEGWKLSPAFDINPSTDKDGLALNIDVNSNALDIELARSVGSYFQLSVKEMDAITNEIKEAVGSWKEVAQRIGISRAEQEMMASAFKQF
jgi:serine/threonine-protein kinase HipA